MSDERRVIVVLSTRSLIAVLVTIAIGWALVTVRSALLWVFIALFLTFVLDAPVRILAGHDRMSRGRAAAIVVLGLFALGGFVLLLLVGPLVRELADLVRALPEIVADLRQSDVFKSLDERTDLGMQAQQHAGDLARKVPAAAIDIVGLGGAVFGVLLGVVSVLFMTLFLLVDLPSLRAALVSVLYPGSAERFVRVEQRIGVTISRYAIGAIAIATIAGIVQGGTAALLGAPFALGLGVIAGLLDLIPQIGATIAGAIVTLVTLTQGVTPAIVMLVVVLVYQQVENYVLQPAIQGKAADISGFFVIASVVVFGALLGVVGALVAVPLTASAQIVVRELTAERRARIAALRAADDDEEAAVAGAALAAGEAGP